MNTQIFQIEHKLIIFLTSGRESNQSSQFTQSGRVKLEASIDKGFEPGTFRSLVQHLKPLGHATSTILSNTVKPVLTRPHVSGHKFESINALATFTEK